MKFKARKTSIRGKLSVGERLKRTRKRKNLSLQDIEEVTKIRTKYLEAIENNQYDNLPNDVYVRGFVQSYSAALSLDGRELVEQYNREKDVKVEVENRILPPSASVDAPRFVFTPRLIIYVVMILIFSGLAVYIWYQVSGFAIAPKLSITKPASSSLTVSSDSVLIEGDTESGAVVTISGQAIDVDKTGHFSANIRLQEGLNDINVVAKNKIGKVSSQDINVLAKWSDNSTNSTNQ